MKLDKKFYGEIRKAKNDALVADDEYVVFLAKDNAFAGPFGAVYHYLARCIALHADEEQIEAVRALIGRLESWRSEHRELLKVPDAVDEKLLP